MNNEDLSELINYLNKYPELNEWLSQFNQSENPEIDFKLIAPVVSGLQLEYDALEKKYFETRGKLTDSKSELWQRNKDIKELKRALSVVETTEEKNRQLKEVALEPSYGRIPPQNVALEEIILRSYIKNRKLMESDSQPYLNLMFYKDVHKILHSALMNLPKKITGQMLVSELRKREELDLVGGPYFIKQLTEENKEITDDPDIIKKYIDELEHHYLAREGIIFAGELSKKMFCESDKIESMPEELRNQSLKLLELLPFRFRKTYDRRSALIQVKEDLADLEKRNGQPRISTGYKSLDKIIHGILPNKFFINGARGKQGKTTLTLCIADNIAKQGYPVAYFNHELTTEQMLQKLASRKAKVDVEKFEYYETGFTSEEKQHIEKAFEEINELPLFFEGGRPNTLEKIVKTSNRFNKFNTELDIINKCKRLKSSYPDLCLIIFDGLQAYEHLVPERGNKSDFFYKVLSAMKYEIAEPLGVSVFLNAQLKGDVEKYKNKKPRSVGDFSDCKGIPEVSDGAFLLYRPEAYFDAKEYQGWMNIHPVELRSGDKRKKQFKLGVDLKYSDIFEI